MLPGMISMNRAICVGWDCRVSARRYLGASRDGDVPVSTFDSFGEGSRGSDGLHAFEDTLEDLGLVYFGICVH